MSNLRDKFTPEEWERLQKRAVRVATAVQDTDTREILILLVMSINGERYAVNASKIRAVHTGISVLPLPNVPKHIGGLANIRGSLTTVINMMALLNLQSSQTNTLKTLVELNDGNLALHVDDVDGVQEYFAEDLEALPDDVNGLHTRGLFEDGTVFLDLDSILNDPKLVVDQK